MRILCDDGTANGTITPAQIAALVTLTDIETQLMSANDVVENVLANVMSYVFTGQDKNKTKNFLSSAGCTVAVPANMPVGYYADWIQGGDGILSFQSDAGAGQSVLSPAGLRSGARPGGPADRR